MKWMLSVGIAVAAVSAAVSAQAGKDMNAPKMGDKMTMTYTGCVEVVNHGSSFQLTHLVDDHQAMMEHDGMMKGDAGMAKKDEPAPVVLTGRSDLKKYVGQKVTVTGSLSRGMSESMPKDRDTLTVASLKVVAKSCS
jgi:hypothetical protein